MFYEVQDVLDEKKKTLKTKILADYQLPLKGFIGCSKCSRTLCGFKLVILDMYANDTAEHKDSKASLAKQLTEYSTKIARARELLLIGDIDGTDYKQIKQDCERNISAIEAQLADAKKKSYTQEQLAPIIDKAITTFTKLNVIYCKSRTEGKRKLIGSMFPEKFTFENLKHRTATVSDAYDYIYKIINRLDPNKTGQNPSKKTLPRQGWITVQNSNRFVDELIEVGDFSKILEE